MRQNLTSNIHPIKLSQNENPFGPSLKAIAASAPDVFRYPDLFHLELKQKIAAAQGVGAEQIVLGAGSIELIDICIKALSRPGDSIVTAEVTFEGYRIMALNNDRAVKLAPLQHYAVNLSGLKALCDEMTRIVFVANPNNPTGSMLTHNEFSDFLASLPSEVFVISDEAYKEYITDAHFPKSLDLQRVHPNLVIFRTFSKIYGLAGLRLGYAIASPEVAQTINRRRTPFSVSGMAAAAAYAALDDQDYVEKCVSVNAGERDSLFRVLLRLGYNAMEPKGNFIFIDFQTTKEKDELFEHLKKHNIHIRKLDNFGVHTGLRITVGRPEDNRILVDVLEKFSALE